MNEYVIESWKLPFYTAELDACSFEYEHYVEADNPERVVLFVKDHGNAPLGSCIKTAEANAYQEKGHV